MKELSEQAKEARNNYLRKWRRRNPEKHKQHIANYWERRAEKEEAEKAKLFQKLLAPKCKGCGTRVVGKRKGAKYCSDACRQKYYRAK